MKPLVAVLHDRGRVLAGAEVGETNADGCDARFFVFGMVGAEADEDVQGVLPVCAGLLILVQGVVGEPVMGAGLVVGLAEFGGERGPVVVGDGGVRVAGDVLYSAEALPRFDLHVAVARLVGEVEQSLKVVDGQLVSALPPVNLAEAD
jgi:hypothetical protein